MAEEEKNKDEIKKNNYLIVKSDFNDLKELLELKLLSKRNELNPNDSEYIKNMFNNIVYAVDNMSGNINNISYLDDESYLSLVGIMLNIKYEVDRLKDHDIDNEQSLFKIFSNMISIDNTLKNYIEITNLKSYEEKAKNIIRALNDQKEDLENSIAQSKILNDDLKNKKVNEIFEDDSKRFKKQPDYMKFYFIW